MIAPKDFNRVVRKQLQALMQQHAQQAFTLRPKSPTPPFVCLTVCELQYIQECGGGAYELAAWVGVVNMANSRRSAEFRSRIRDLAKLMGCRYRKAGPLLDWLESIGLLQINRSTDVYGSCYRLGTIRRSELAPLRHVVPKSSAQPAQVTSARHADSLQEGESIKSLQEKGEAAAPLCVRATPASRQLLIRESPRGPVEIEPTAAAIAEAFQGMTQYGAGEIVRFVATNNPNGHITDVLNGSLGSLPDVELRRICAEVYAKGNAQHPAWSPGKRAEVLTARLKAFCGQPQAA